MRVLSSRLPGGLQSLYNGYVGSTGVLFSLCVATEMFGPIRGWSLAACI